MFEERGERERGGSRDEEGETCLRREEKWRIGERREKGRTNERGGRDS